MKYFGAFIIFVVTLLLTFSGCHEDKRTSQINENTIEYQINLAENVTNFKPLKLSEISTAIKYIPLETNNESIIKRIADIDISKKYILISSSENVCLFNKKGSFINVISRKGNGPNDFNLTTSIKISEDKVYVPCVFKNTIMVFDFNGKNIEHIPLPEDLLGTGQFLKNWIISKNNNILIHIPNRTGKEKFRIIEIDRKGEMINGFNNTSFFNVANNKKTNHLAMSTIALDGHLYKHYEKIRITHRLADTIWEVKNNNLVPVITVEKGDYALTNSALGMSVHSSELSKALKKVIFVWFTFETSSHLFLKTRFGENYPFKFKKSPIHGPAGTIEPKHEILGVYNKATTEFFFVAPSGVDHQLEPLGIENDIDGGINFAPIYSPNERTLVSWFNAYDLKAHVASEAFRSSTPKYPERKRELEALANRLKDDDNPVLMVVTFKE